jgi:hypothetical protein
MKPLNSITKRDMLAATKFKIETIRAYGAEFLDEGRLGDAFEFFRKADDQSGVRKTLKRAVSASDTDLIWRIEKVYPDLVEKSHWIECGEEAMTAEKFRVAAYAFAHVRSEELQAKAEKEFMPAEEAPQDAQSPAEA